MTTINIDRKALRAVSRFQAVKDIRYYLNAVCVKSNVVCTVIIATDGHTLAMHKGNWQDENAGECAELLVPSDAVKEMLSWKIGKYDADIVTLTVPDNFAIGGKCRAQNGDNIILFKHVDGKYPDFTRVIPKVVSGEAGHYNAEYLLRCQDAANDLGNGGKHSKHFAQIGQNGKDSPAVVTVSTSDSFVAVIMPMRGENHDAGSWEWAFDPLAVAAEVVTA